MKHFELSQKMTNEHLYYLQHWYPAISGVLCETAVINAKNSEQVQATRSP